MNTTIKMAVAMMAILGVVACGKPGPMDEAADKIAQTTLKNTYANPTNLAQFEQQAKKDWGMDANGLIKACAVAVLQYMKMTPDQARKIASQIASPGSGDDASRDLAAGFSNHLERCLTKPSAYDVSKP